MKSQGSCCFLGLLLSFAGTRAESGSDYEDELFGYQGEGGGGGGPAFEDAGLPSYQAGGVQDGGLLVTTHTGQISGAAETTGGGRSYRVFHAIPFAEPPVGELRLRDPFPKSPWEAIRDGSKSGPPCLQPDLAGGVLGSEDCLTLTIYTPHQPSQQLLPVMVWIPGGGFVVGGASKEDWDPEFFLDKDVVFVVAQYRLGSLGFFALPGNPSLAGNFGLKDQQEALRWLQVSLSRFGGDPSRVTIFGSGSGAVSVHAHILSPQGDGLFQGAISQSGNMLTLYEMMFNNLVERSGQRLAERLNCIDPDPLPCLQALEGSVILDPAQGVQDILVPDSRFFISAPNIDTDSENPFLPYDPLYQTVTGLFKKVPYISGINSDEGAVTLLSDLIGLYKEETSENSLFLMFFLDRDTQYDDLKQVERLMKSFYLGAGAYTDDKQQGLIDMLTDAKLASPLHQTVIGHLYAGARAYPYVLTQRCNDISFSQVFGGKDFGVTAADELPCFFRDAFAETSFSEEQSLISETMLQMWTDFARFGDPNGDPQQGNGTSIWNPGQTMVFGVSGEITSQEEWRDRMFLWDRLYWQTKREILADIVAQVDTEPVTPVNTNSDYEYEEDILPTYMKDLRRI